jgi:hypothetical protein
MIAIGQTEARNSVFSKAIQIKRVSIFVSMSIEMVFEHNLKASVKQNEEKDGIHRPRPRNHLIKGVSVK